MFTGIIQHVGRVVAASPRGDGRRLTIDVGPLAKGLELGASLAVNGVCLTARAVRGDRAEFDAVAETVSRTTLGGLRPGDRVNLERSLRLGDGLDGHLVQGHVDGLAEVQTVRKTAAGGGWVIRFAAPTDLTDQMVPKGSGAIDGVSLTLVDVEAGEFSVALIPETLERTTLADLAPGRRVNIETDVLGKYVRKYVLAMKEPEPAANDGKGITIERLRETGFL
jgi:riboflavin synthase